MRMTENNRVYQARKQNSLRRGMAVALLFTILLGVLAPFTAFAQEPE